MVKELGVALDRKYRNTDNDNFVEHENEINALNGQVGIIERNLIEQEIRITESEIDITDVDERISYLIANNGNGEKDTEITDARQEKNGTIHTSLRAHTNAIHDKLDELSLALLDIDGGDFGDGETTAILVDGGAW